MLRVATRASWSPIRAQPKVPTGLQSRREAPRMGQPSLGPCAVIWAPSRLALQSPWGVRTAMEGHGGPLLAALQKTWPPPSTQPPQAPRSPQAGPRPSPSPAGPLPAPWPHWAWLPGQRADPPSVGSWLQPCGASAFPAPLGLGPQSSRPTWGSGPEGSWGGGEGWSAGLRLDTSGSRTWAR